MTADEQVSKLVGDYSGELSVVQVIHQRGRDLDLAFSPGPRSKAVPIAQADANGADGRRATGKIRQCALEPTLPRARFRAALKGGVRYASLRGSTGSGSRDQTGSGENRAEHAADSNHCAGAVAT